MTDNDAKKWGERTAAVHAGEAVDPVTRASSPNLVMSATFAPEEVTGFSARNRGNYEGFVYARVSNPTVNSSKKSSPRSRVRRRPMLCLGHGGEPCGPRRPAEPRRSSGHLRHQLCRQPPNWCATACRVSASRSRRSIPPISTTVARAIRPETRMVWIETPANPIMRLADIRAVAELAHGRGVRDVVVDSTFASPIATRPAGARRRLRHPFAHQIHRRSRRCHGRRGARAQVRSRRAQSRSDGALWRRAVAVQCLAHPERRGHPAAAHEGARGNRPRVSRSSSKATAASAASFYPGLPSHPQHELARRQMRNFAGMMTFATRTPGAEVARRMVERLKVVHYAVSLGHHRSLVYWIPTAAVMASTFRLRTRQLSPATVNSPVTAYSGFRSASKMPKTSAPISTGCCSELAFC